MARPRKYTDAERAAALRDYELFGPTYVQRTHGIKKQTVQSWANAEGIRTVRNDVMHEAHQARKLDFKIAREVILENLYIDTIKVQSQMWSPSTVWAFGGASNKFEEHTFDGPTVDDQKKRTDIIQKNLHTAVKLEAVDSTNGVDDAKSVLMGLAAAFGIGVNNDDSNGEDEEAADGAAGSPDDDAEGATES